MYQDNIFRFHKFDVYKNARFFRRDLKQITIKQFPKNEQFALTSQLWRALDSVLLNIAEGCERYSDVDFSRFLNTSLSSLNEVISCLDIALDDGYIVQDQYDNYLEKGRSIYRQLRAFSSKVRKTKLNKGF
jgi:four helix bundle protein